MIKLRDYQEDLYNNVKLAFKQGAKGICAVLPCRAGKSYIMASIAESANKKGNHVLILAHRNSLINQHKELFDNLELNNNMTRIESVFTEVRHLGENGPVDLIIIDECHLSGASSYRKVCEFYNCKIVGFTGSPARLDGKPLDLFDKMVIGISANQLIKQGKISAYEYYAPDLQLDLSSIKKTAGDFNQQQLGEKMSSKNIYGDILKYYKKLGNNEQAVAYCVNINHSKEVCEMFNNNKISAMHMDAKTPEKEREEIMEKFKNHEFQILCNCNLISEGITLPSASVGLLLRPTLSLPLYIQQSNRVLTPVEGKKAIIIDYVNNIQRHGMPTAEREWTLRAKVKEYYNENEDGTFRIRVCQECFGTFETAPVCPYCGAVYETTAVEIQNFKEIELKKIEEAKAAKMQKWRETVEKKVESYKGPTECKNWMELVTWCRLKGYKPGYAFVLNKNLKLNFKIGGK